ncbi:acetyltransferase [Kineosporia sp. NBRC 101677]|uniref:GNAT family N-acetyltransferase n=1 Tax=Kineosporia sp. NBRC 101677 TaxID=3032197 RepID=UPI0024A48264|nr:GNAT family N-acetyltransferase [Kineosporia sp. NBRC 101677]GLY15478.1 acetyltransferase [Kineosporia sp. NBRC 101677]
MLRTATAEDIPATEELMRASVLGLFPGFHDPAETGAAARFITDLDRDLVADGTYYVIEEQGELVACGGWSRRAKLHTGTGHTHDDDARLLDPATEPARVRAMFVRPDRTRRGLARQILAAAESAAQAEGFGEFVLMATRPGVPLYRALGFVVVEETSFATPNGVRLECAVMHKPIG